MTYDHLARAPKDHNSPEFIDFLRANNKVIWENPQWIVIENCKYHTPEKPWLTAFWKGDHLTGDWYFDADIMHYEFGEYEWLIKAPKNRTVTRFHIHLIQK